MVHAESTTASGPPVLSPQPIIEAITQVDGMLKKVEQAVIEIMRDIDSKNKVSQYVGLVRPFFYEYMLKVSTASIALE